MKSIFMDLDFGLAYFTEVGGRQGERERGQERERIECYLIFFSVIDERGGGGTVIDNIYM